MMLSKFLAEWFPKAAATLDAGPRAPRELYQRLTYICDLLKAIGTAPDRAILAWRQEDDQARCHVTGETLVVGRAAPSELIILDPKLSRCHFQIDVRGDRAWIRDIHSRNGTYVNGKRVQQREMLHGDIIEAGALAYVFFNRMV
ncbi:MAG: FHA domain-containing protein [Verrucomicrobia bacterium]|nr:FHA domain-containing protein [Verrucomicrobiota bacterium]